MLKHGWARYQFFTSYYGGTMVYVTHVAILGANQEENVV